MEYSNYHFCLKAKFHPLIEGSTPQGGAMPPLAEVGLGEAEGSLRKESQSH